MPEPTPISRRLPASLFGGDVLNPLRIRFLLGHWLEIVSLAEASSEEAVSDLREALRYEFDHLSTQHIIPCLCRFGWFNPPKAVRSGGGSIGGRSFSDIVPSIETAYEGLPMGWTGRTKVWLMMGGVDQISMPPKVRARLQGMNAEEAVDFLRERESRHAESIFDKAHVQRVRTELRRPGFRPRPQDTEDETGSVWRRMAYEIGWRPREELIPELPPEQEQAA